MILRTIPDFSTAKMLVAGDVMLDSYWHGRTERISPEAPVPVVRVDQEEHRIGGAGNVAVNVADLGGHVQLVGLAGIDDAAERLERMLAQRGVACRLQRVPGSRTNTKLRVISRHQQMIRLDFEDPFQDWDPEALVRDFQAALDGVDLVILSDYAKGALRTAKTLVQLARAAGRRVVIDPKGRDFERYRGATLITPNLAELEAVVGHCEDEAAIVERGTALLDSLELEALLVTRSEKGMTLIERGRAPLQLPTRAREVYDVTGAGDTVVAVTGAAMAAGLPIAQAVALSNVAAGLVVGKLGTATVTPAELTRALALE